VTNVMGGVDALVKSEMAKLTQQSVEQFAALQTSNVEINSANSDLEKQITADSTAVAERNVVSQTKVGEWGDAVQAVHEHVNELEVQNDSASFHVKETTRCLTTI